MNIRLYVRSVYRTICAQLEIINDLKEIYENFLGIHKKKKQLNQAVTFNKEILERKRELINSKSSIFQSKNINLIR